MRYNELLEDIGEQIIKSKEKTIKKQKTLIWTLTAFLLACVLIIGYLYYDVCKWQKTAEDSCASYENLSQKHSLLEDALNLIFSSENVPLNDSTVVETLRGLDVWYPDIIMAQIKLESGFAYTSNLCQKNNNLFGMRRVYNRNTTQIGYDDKGFGKYMTWRQSVVDRLLWDRHVFSEDMYEFKDGKPSREDYLKTLGKRYAEDTIYLSKISALTKVVAPYFND